MARQQRDAFFDPSSRFSGATKSKIWSYEAKKWLSRKALLPSFHRSKNQLHRTKIDQQPAVAMSPLVTDRLETPITAHFVNFHWPATPYTTKMRVMAVDVAQA